MNRLKDDNNNIPMNKLKELRKDKGLSQKALSKETGVPLRTLQSWENRESQIKPEKAQQLADYFGVSVGYLLGYSDSKSPQDYVETQIQSPDFSFYPDYGGDSDTPIDPYTMFSVATVGEKFSDRFKEIVLDFADGDLTRAGRYINALNKLPLPLQKQLAHLLLLPDSSKESIIKMLEALFYDTNHTQQKND